MPNQKAPAEGQKLRAFAQACNNAIGTISCLEAHTAIQEYLTKWNAA